MSSTEDSNSNEQPKTGKDSKFDLDRRSVEAAEKSASWTTYGVYVGAAGTFFIILTLIANWRATNVMRKEFLESHQPKIVLRQVVVPVEVSVPLKGRCLIVNEGGTSAKIKEGRSQFYLTNTYFPQLHPGWAFFGNPLPNSKIKSIGKGGHEWWDISEDSAIEGKVILDASQLRRLKEKRLHLYFTGLIIYSDNATKIPHNTMFCLKYDPEIDRWIRTNDPDFDIAY